MSDTATRPILFNGDMVRAILDGRKTKTRRVVKMQPRESPHPSTPNAWQILNGPDEGLWRWRTADGLGWQDEGVICPLGRPGDRLYVRESFRPFMDGWSCGVEFAAGGEMQVAGDAGKQLDDLIKHSGGDLRFSGAREEFINKRWRPSIHMPRWASRITLEITSVRAERLQDTRAADALAEGIKGATYLSNRAKLRDFRVLWDSVAKIEHLWLSNPWVWVVEFKRLAKPGDGQGDGKHPF